MRNKLHAGTQQALGLKMSSPLSSVCLRSCPSVLLVTALSGCGEEPAPAPTGAAGAATEAVAGAGSTTAGTGGLGGTTGVGAGAANNASTAGLGDAAQAGTPGAAGTANDAPPVVITAENGTAGVVVDQNCVPLCVTATEPTEAGSDWSYENDGSCILAGTVTSANQACVIGEALPALESRPGVVRGGECFALCQVVMTPTDPDEPDWSYENNAPCILPGTKAATSQACMTGQALPDPSELDGRPGVVVLDDDNAKRCAALCTYTLDVALDAEGDDWDYEYEDSCVIPNSETALNQACVTGEAIPAPVAKPGVVVVDGAGVAACTPLCVIHADPALDPEGDGWAYEDNSSCVIPETAAALTNPACTTGAELPAETSKSGVVVKIEEGVLECVPTCTFYTSPTQDGADLDEAADDWAWEGNNECIIPGTKTELANIPCTTLTELPTPPPKPGIYVNSDPVEDSCASTACVPLCTVVTTPENPEYPDWGWEFNESCVLPGTPTASVIGGDAAKSIENHGYEVAPRTCTWGEPLPNYYAPPALDEAKLVSPTFFTDGASVKDPYGNAFVARAINNSHCWYDICGQYSALDALDAIAATGANAVRIGWAFDSIDPGGPSEGEALKDVIGTNPDLLAEILYRTVELGMIPLVAFNDSTGQTDSAWPKRMADLIVSDGYLELFKAYEHYLLLGIANELNVGDASPSSWASSYTPAFETLRSAGLDMTLIVTANRWGQGCDNVIEQARNMIAADPNQNLLFDLHIYSYLQFFLSGADNTEAGPEAARVTGCLNALKDLDVPTLVGEFGFFHGEGEQRKDVAWETIISTCDSNGQGYAPWLWYGDTEYPELNMNSRWPGPLTTWGSNATSPLRNSTKASILLE